MNLLVDISTNLSSCISFSIFCKKQTVACLFIIRQTTLEEQPFSTSWSTRIFLLAGFTPNNYFDNYLVNNNRPLYSSYFIIFEIAHIIAVTNKSSHLNLKQNNKRRYWYVTQN